MGRAGGCWAIAPHSGNFMSLALLKFAPLLCLHSHGLALATSSLYGLKWSVLLLVAATGLLHKLFVLLAAPDPSLLGGSCSPSRLSSGILFCHSLSNSRFTCVIIPKLMISTPLVHRWLVNNSGSYGTWGPGFFACGSTETPAVGLGFPRP